MCDSLRPWVIMRHIHLLYLRPRLPNDHRSRSMQHTLLHNYALKSERESTAYLRTPILSALCVCMHSASAKPTFSSQARICATFFFCKPRSTLAKYGSRVLVDVDQHARQT
jgi:hypothetical protein